MPALAACLLAAGCQSLGLDRDARLQVSTTIDGLRLPARPWATTREVISMLGLEEACRSPGPACADAILDSPDPMRPGIRLIAAADVLFLHGRGATADARTQALTRCGVLTHRYLFGPNLPGRFGPLDARSQMALRLHNACTSGLVQDIADRPQSIRWRVDERRFPRSAVERLELAAALRPKGLRTRQIKDGIGAPAVAFGRTEEAVGAFPAQPFALPVTVQLIVDAEGNASLLATDASREESVATVFGDIPLARDLSAAYASAAIAFEEELDMWRLLRGAPDDDGEPQIRLLAPIDYHKDVVVLVHGFASSPMTWANMVNELLGDPRVSDRYQFWLARYPTGLPFLVNRQGLAGTITDFRERGRLSPYHPQPPMVIVGHSMGGVLTRLLATDSGTALWDAAFTVPPDALQADAADIQAARELFMFEPLEGVDDIVLIAAPHRGSLMAEGMMARLVRRFIGGPRDVLDYLVRMTLGHPDQVQPELRDNYLAGGPDSLATLSPAQPVSRAASELPTAPGVGVHSIIGILDPEDAARGDGVVSLESASWPDGAEYRVRGGHDLQTLPETITVLKRILLARLPASRLTPQPAPAE
ncbi:MULTISPECIES: esterase/lipase family protein [unclassified Luteimonas]